LDKGDFIYAIEDFYLTNPIARASILMSELSAQARARSSGKIAAE
jgi:NADH-quinone oxidoreductase subunit G